MRRNEHAINPEGYRAYYRAYMKKRFAEKPEVWERQKEATRRWRARQSPETQRLRARKHNLQSQYRLSLEQYDALLTTQGGVCAICLQPPPRTQKTSVLEVDHNHETGEIRGLLCHVCNQGMIAVDRREGWLENARKYVER